MLHGRLLNLIALAVLASLATLASPWAAAAGADVAQVTVVSPGGAEQTLALDALVGSEGVVSRAYAVRSSGGESTQTASGFSLATILEAAGADPYGFNYLEVQRPAGGAVLLSRHQALNPGAFPDGPPLVYATASGTAFLRPSAGADDLNVGDSFEAPQGISIVLRKGSRLQVKATASTPKTRPGKPVHFSATVEGAGSGEELTYSWYFDDGASARTPEATHAFAKRGTYDVVVGVTSAGDDAGASAVATVQVGAPIAGPNRKGGGNSDDAGAPDHGAADGSGSTPSSTPVTPAAPMESRAHATPPQAPARGELVEGELVSAETAAPTPAPKQAAARSGQLQSDDGGGDIPDAAWGLLATVGLFGAGALIESRNLLA